MMSTLALLTSACSHATESTSKALRAQSQEVVFKAKDGSDAFGDLYRGPNGGKTVILMFHQARSNSTEYSPIAPRVAKLGFDCLAVDLRSGGEMFNAINRSVRAHRGSKDYEAAYLDMEGAVEWAKGQRYSKIILWGSSYSASLSLRMASEAPEVKAVLAFSPGEFFADKGVARGWASKDRVPTLMAFTQDELREGGNDLFKALPRSPKNALVSFSDGVHGSSTLRSDANPGGQIHYWADVEMFLAANS